MEFLKQAANIFLHLDVHLNEVIQAYGTLTYAILFLIIFCETGLIITPFLPGDSLLFTSGSLAALGSLSYPAVFFWLCLAAILGDSSNYWIGHHVGARGFKKNTRFLKQSYLDRTQAFYEQHGAKTVLLARFLPILRTFAPFVAGMGKMPYSRFVFFSVTGTLLWVGLCSLAGYAFGNIPVIKANFSLVVLGIIGVSLLPAIYGALKARKNPA